MKIEKLAPWVEIAANLGVIVTLLLLVTEVRNNTAVLERQALLDRGHAMSDPFVENPAMAGILARIKEVDGWLETYEPAFVERYDVPIEHAIVWGRHLVMVWAGLEADFVLDGASPELDQRIRMLLTFPDNQLLWDLEEPGMFGEEFTEHVLAIRAADGRRR